MPGARPREAIRAEITQRCLPSPATKGLSLHLLFRDRRRADGRRTTAGATGRNARNAADAGRQAQKCSAPSARAGNSPSTSLYIDRRRRSGKIRWTMRRLPPWSTRRSVRASGRRGRSLAWRARRPSSGEVPRERDRTPKIIHHQQGHRDHQLGTRPPEVPGSR